MRADNIDVLKAACAFLIVCIHVPFPGEFGAYITALARIGVPIFFMITGYFYSDVVKKSREVGQIKKILKLIIEGNLLYLVLNLFSVIFKGGGMGAFLRQFSFNSLLKFLLFNDSPFKGHLWYLGAILYVLIIVYVVDKFRGRRVLYTLIPILLLGDLMFGKYSIVLWEREFPSILVRNFLFVGVPYFSIGLLIRDGVGGKIKKRILGILIIVFSLTTLLERFILVSINMNATRDHYLSTTFLAITVFLFSLKCAGWNGHISVIGRKYSTWLYILHPIFITGIGMVMKKLGIYGIYRFIAPLVVYVATLVFLFFINKCKSIIRNSQ